MAEATIGWDVGGAHLKAARLDAAGRVLGVIQVPCPLWQGIEHLHSAMAQVGRDLGPAPRHAVTMTGEMVDLFSDRAEGVTRLVAAIAERIAAESVEFYAGPLGFLDADRAVAKPGAVASANWMATAAFAATRFDSALLLDIGSTTTDLIPILAGRVAARGSDDAARLVGGELIYTGVVRTPLMVFAERVPFAGEWSPLMAEYFATAADIYRLLGQLPAGADQHPAADGGEKTVEASARRLARMIGRDLHSAPLSAWQGLAAWLRAAQVQRIEDGCVRLLSRESMQGSTALIVAGVGRFLAAEFRIVGAGHPRVGFETLIPASEGMEGRVADCAPAVAVAALAQRMT